MAKKKKVVKKKKVAKKKVTAKKQDVSAILDFALAATLAERSLPVVMEKQSATVVTVALAGVVVTIEAA